MRQVQACVVDKWHADVDPAVSPLLLHILGRHAVDGEGHDAGPAPALVVHVDSTEVLQGLAEQVREGRDAYFDGLQSPGQGVVDGHAEANLNRNRFTYRDNLIRRSAGPIASDGP